MKKLAKEQKSLKLEDLQGLEIQDQLTSINGGKEVDCGTTVEICYDDGTGHNAWFDEGCC